MIQKWRQHLAALLANMTTLQAGFLLGWTSPTLPSMNLTANEQSWVSSLALLGALIGAMPAGWLADKMGRKNFVLALAVPYTIGGALVTAGAATNNVWLMYAGRFLSGLALGATTVAVPIYSNEIAEDSVRGALGVYLDMMLTVGILVAYILGAFMDPPHLAGVACIAPVIFAGLFAFMPESPVHLVADGKLREAERALKWLRNVADDDVEIQLELARIRSVTDHAPTATNVNGGLHTMPTSSAAAFAAAPATAPASGPAPAPAPAPAIVPAAANGVVLSVPLTQQLTSSSARSRSGSVSGVRETLQRLAAAPSPTGRAFFIVVGLMVFMQLSGIDAIIVYLGEIFSEAGSSLSALNASIVVGGVQVIANICSSLLVDRVGRRVLLLLSEGFMAASLAVLALYFHQKELSSDVALEYGWVPVTALSVYIWVFAVGIGSLPWFMMAELLPQDSLDWGSSTCICLNWSLGFIVTNVFGSMKGALGSAGTYSVFCSICIVGTVFMALLVPETKGRSPEEIQRLLAASTTYCSIKKATKPIKV